MIRLLFVSLVLVGYVQGQTDSLTPSSSQSMMSTTTTTTATAATATTATLETSSSDIMAAMSTGDTSMMEAMSSSAAASTSETSSSDIMAAMSTGIMAAMSTSTAAAAASTSGSSTDAANASTTSVSTSSSGSTSITCHMCHTVATDGTCGDSTPVGSETCTSALGCWAVKYANTSDNVWWYARGCLTHSHVTTNYDLALVSACTSAHSSAFIGVCTPTKLSFAKCCTTSNCNTWTDTQTACGGVGIITATSLGLYMLLVILQKIF